MAIASTIGDRYLTEVAQYSHLCVPLKKAARPDQANGRFGAVHSRHAGTSTLPDRGKLSARALMMMPAV